MSLIGSRSAARPLRVEETMSGDDGFLDAILASPADDTPRLVYADWLDDNGDTARAEFIRVQCELARLEGESCRRRSLEVRERKLQAANAARWLGRLKGCPRDRVFRRGFLERVRLHAQTFAAHGRALFRLGPVREVLLVGAGRYALSLGLSPWLERLEVLGLRGNGLGDWSVQFLGRSPFLSGLRRLDLGDNGVGDGGVAALAGSPHLAGLNELRLDGNAIGETGLRALTASPHLAGLQRLDLSRNGADRQGRGARALLDRFGDRVRL